MREAWAPGPARSWLFIAGLVMARELWLLWSGLDKNHPDDDETLLPTLGYGNLLTLARGIAIALLAGFLFSPRPPGWLAWLPAIAYFAIAVFDHLDGYVARVTGHTTKLGEILDMEFDVLGIFFAVALAISYGQLPPWYLVIGLAREIFLLGIWLRKRFDKPVYDLPPSMDRRLIAGLQMSFLSVVLWPIFTPPATTIAAVLFAMPMVISFGRDWMVVSGAWRTDSPGYQRRRRTAKLILERWLPLLCRAVGTVVAVTILAREMPGFSTWSAALPVSTFWFFLLAAPALVSTLFFALGFMGRIAAVGLIALACADILLAGFDLPSNGLLLICTIIVLQMGSGSYALWQPEERLLRHRAGETAEEPE